MKKTLVFSCLLLGTVALISLLALAQSSSEVSTLAIANQNHLTTATTKQHSPNWLSLLPPLLAIGSAFVLRQVIVALFLGIWVGGWITYDLSPSGLYYGLLDTIPVYVRGGLVDEERISILMFSLMIGGMVGIIIKNGGTIAMVNRVIPWARSPRRGQIATSILGIVIFFDDYANTSIVGNAMRPIVDRLKISREKLAYIVDSTAVAAAILSIAQGILTLSETVDAWVAGMKSILPTMVILTLAWGLSAVLNEIGTIEFLTSLLGDRLIPELIPTVVFLLSGIIAFATGSSWGTMAILMPLVVPLSWTALSQGNMASSAIFYSSISMVDCPNLGSRSFVSDTSHLGQKNLINKFTGMMSNFWSYLLHQLQNDRQVFLALVASHTQGSPGTTGAKMFISETGEIYGTIGGGIMEHKLIERAKEILKQKDFQPEIQTLYHRASGSGDKSGMICSGSQTNLYYLCQPSREIETIEKVAFIVERDISGFLSIDSSGMSVVEKAVNLAQPAIQLIQESEKWKYEEQLLNRQRIAIIGGGHCSLALSRVMSQLNYNVLVFDTRHEVSTLTQNIYAQSVKIVEDYQEVGALIPFVRLTCVVVVTTDFPSDIRALLGVASFPFPFIGVMGSRAKIATIFEQLQQAGVSENVLSRLYAPVGLPIGSHTPEEIAISIAAQILQEKKKWQNP